MPPHDVTPPPMVVGQPAPSRVFPPPRLGDRAQPPGPPRAPGRSFFRKFLLVCGGSFSAAVAIGLLGLLASSAFRPDPVASLRALVASVKERGSEKYVARAMTYDVVKTESLVSPYVATVDWASYERAASDSEPGDEPRFRGAYWARLAFQDGRWVLREVGEGSPNAEPSYLRPNRHSMLDEKDAMNPINDWWRAFGGK